MQIYVINLDQRKDRLASMQSQFTAQNLTFTRISAINGLGNENIGFSGDTSELSKPEYACYLSHLKAYKALIDSNESHALIVEDDMVLSRNIADILSKPKFFDQANTIVRLETPFQCIQNMPVLLGRFSRSKTHYCKLRRLYSMTECLGAYVISRNLAERVLRDFSQPAMVIDRLLLRDNMVNQPMILQIDPPQAVQARFLAGSGQNSAADSDLEIARASRFLTNRLVANKIPANTSQLPLLNRIIRRGIRNFKGNTMRIGQAIMRLSFREKVLRYSNK